MTAREYSKVLPSFWTGTTGRAIRALGADCQVIALYLLTSPHASAIGLYHLPLAYLCADTGSPLEGARKALRSLSEVSFCAYDEASETVWIPEMARHQVGEAIKASDNRRPWLVKEAERMRKRPFFNDFLEKYGAAFSLGIAPDAKPLGSPLEAPSKALRSQEQEQEREQEQEHECETRAHDPAEVAPHVATFRAYVAAVEAKTGRHEAETPEKLKAAKAAHEELARTAANRGTTLDALLATSVARWLADPFGKRTGWKFTEWAKQAAALAVSEPAANRKQNIAPPSSHADFARIVAENGGEEKGYVEVGF